MFNLQAFFNRASDFGLTPFQCVPEVCILFWELRYVTSTLSYQLISCFYVIYFQAWSFNVRKYFWQATPVSLQWFIPKYLVLILVAWQPYSLSLRSVPFSQSNQINRLGILPYRCKYNQRSDHEQVVVIYMYMYFNILTVKSMVTCITTGKYVHSTYVDYGNGVLIIIIF